MPQALLTFSLLTITYYLFAEGKTGTPEGTRSIKERLRQAVAGNAHPRCILSFESIGLYLKNGTPEGTRTPDLLLRRQLLYPAELLAHILERVTGIGPAYPAWRLVFYH